MTIKRTLDINGLEAEHEFSPDTTLLELVRGLGLTGSKEACGRGECGACTMLIDGRTVNGCTTLAARAHGQISTIEGIAEDAADLRRNFAHYGGLQCGFCTPGMVVRAHWIVTTYQGPWTREAIRSQLAGNICRCTGYQGIVDAILATREGREPAHSDRGR